MQFNLVYSERGDSGIKCNNLYLSWQTVLKNLRLEKITLDLRMTWIDCHLNRSLSSRLQAPPADSPHLDRTLAFL